MQSSDAFWNVAALMPWRWSDEASGRGGRAELHPWPRAEAGVGTELDWRSAYKTNGGGIGHSLKQCALQNVCWNHWQPQGKLLSWPRVPQQSECLACCSICVQSLVRMKNAVSCKEMALSAVVLLQARTRGQQSRDRVKHTTIAIVRLQTTGELM